MPTRQHYDSSLTEKDRLEIKKYLHSCLNIPRTSTCIYCSKRSWQYLTEILREVAFDKKSDFIFT